MARELINVEAVDRSFGAVDVLQDINLKVNDGDRIGIVGHNGAGKTTLLNTISEQKQDTGDVEFAPGIRLAYLTQIRDLESDSTIEEELGRKGRQFQELEEEIAAIEAQMVDPAFYEGDWEPVMERYTELQQTLASSGGGNVAGIAKGILERLDLIGGLALLVRVHHLGVGDVRGERGELVRIDETVDDDLPNARHGLVPLDLRVAQVGVRRTHVGLVVARRHCACGVGVGCAACSLFFKVNQTPTVSGLCCLKRRRFGVMYF